VYLDYGKPTARAIARAAPASLQREGFASGSMGPKVAAAADFAETAGRVTAIGRLEDAVSLLAGTAGTQVDKTAGETTTRRSSPAAAPAT
jgi:carbamate kinase